MAITGIGNNYNSTYESTYATAKKEGQTIKTTSVQNPAETATKSSSEEYLNKLQRQVSYVNLEAGFGLSTKRDNKIGTITINPMLLKKMQSDPEAEKKYTQTLKDIESAERTANAYYNSLGGCVERTSHWYIDENGKYYHFAYTRRDDKLNKKLREEAKKNSEKLIEKTREKTTKKKKALQELIEKKSEEKAKAASDEEKAEIEERLSGNESELTDVGAVKKQGEDANKASGNLVDYSV